MAAIRRASSRVSSLGAARSGPAPALFGHGPRADADHRRGCRNYTAARQLGLKPPWALRVKDLRALSHDRGRLLMILGEAGKPSTTAVHVVFGAYFLGEPRESHFDLPADVLPILPCGAELQRLRAFPAIRFRNSNGLNSGVHEGEYQVPWRHLPHRLIEGISCSAGASLRRPQISALHLVAVGLILVDPPVAHRRRQSGLHTRQRMPNLHVRIDHAPRYPLLLYGLLDGPFAG